MTPAELKSRMQAVLLSRQPQPAVGVAVSEASELLKDPRVRLHAEELVALKARSVSAATQLSVVAGRLVTPTTWQQVRELIQENPAPHSAEIGVSASAVASVTEVSTSAGETEDARIRILLEHAHERAIGVHEMYLHQMQVIRERMTAGAPIPAERLHNLLKTVDTASSAARTATTIFETIASQTTTGFSGEVTGAGRAPLSLGEQEGRQIIIVEPPPQGFDSKEDTDDASGDRPVLPKWEPLLP